MVTSDAGGRFNFGGLTMGGAYRVSVSSKRSRFTPMTVSITRLITDLDMIAEE